MNQRLLKINKLLSRELSKLLQEEFTEKFGMITVAYVNCAPNLKIAKVGISVFNKSNEENILQILNLRSEKLRCAIGRRIELKNMPRLRFEFDSNAKKVNKIDKLLNQIAKENV